MTVSDWSPGQGVQGFIADAENSFDPVTEGYPPSNPTTGFGTKNEGFAGIIHGRPTDGSPTLNLYCFDINTDTSGGINYILGTWNASNVPNVNYVAQVLNNYYPQTDAPAALTDLNQKAAAVQAAIWFFSDRFVLNTSDPLHDTVAGIVAAVIAKGPAPPPDPPSVNITPNTLSGTGSVLGPFTVTAAGPATSASVTAVGANMFADAAATQPIDPGTTVPSGTQIWLKQTGQGAAVLQATAKAMVPQNNVYLYDGTNGVPDAQRLILAQDATLTTTVSAKALFSETGSLIVQKAVTGPAAGRQGAVTINVRCGGVLIGDPFVIPAGSTGTASQTYDNIPVGTSCIVTEIHDGSTSTVTVEVEGSGQPVTVAAGPTTATITDTYRFVRPGVLVVKKSIKGPGAGQQGEIVIQPTCGGTDLAAFTIPAGATGEPSKTYQVAPGSVCTITETVDGHTSTVTVTVDGSGQTVTVAGGSSVDAVLTDTYGIAPGSLTVTKAIAGGAAGQQGPITISVTCNENGTDTPLPEFTIAAGAAAGSTSRTYTGIPAGSVCTATETSTGDTSTITTTVTGDDGTPISIPAGATATAKITNTYVSASGGLTVTKTIAGPAAGSQGEVTVHTVCDGTALTPDLVVAAGTAAGKTSRTYDDVPAGATCTVTETSDGSSNTVAVVTAGSPQDVTIPAGGAASADLLDTYELVPGSLTVTKTVDGAAGGDQAAITIGVNCDGLPLPEFTIPAGATGAQSHTYDDIPAGLTCTVTEEADGTSSTIGVVTTGSPQDVKIAANAEVSADITDTYGPLPGSLEVRKTINGPLAGSQGAVTVAVTCGVATLPTWTIPAGTGAQTLTHTYDDIPAGSSCTVTETSDGATATVVATVVGANQTVTVPAATRASLSITDTFTPTSAAVRVVKTLAGPGAGKQGRVGILLICRAPIQVFALVIPAGHPAGPVSQIFNDVGGGSSCLVAEVIDGHTDTLAVSATGARQQVTAPAAGIANVHMTDSFSGPAAQPQLAATGTRAPVAPLIGYGVAAVLAGAGLLLLTRRRS